MKANAYRLLALGIALALAGCSSGPRLDASSSSALLASFQRYILEGPAKTRPARVKAIDELKQVYFIGDRFKGGTPLAVPPVSDLHRLRFEDVPEVAAKVSDWAEHGQHVASPSLPPESQTERRWRNQFLIDQLKVERDILNAEKENARYKDLFTVDQLQFHDASFIPPQQGVPLGQDKATFVASFKNTAVFNVYGVGFHVVVRDPRMKYPVVDQELKLDLSKDPIQVGEERQVQLTCCDSFADSTRNLQLRTLPENADIQMDLVTVQDYSKKNRLEDAGFTSADNLKLVAAETCLADIQARIDRWTPDNASPACRQY